MLVLLMSDHRSHSCSTSTLLTSFSVIFRHACLWCYVSCFTTNSPLFLIINMSWFKSLSLLLSPYTKSVRPDTNYIFPLTTLKICSKDFTICQSGFIFYPMLNKGIENYQRLLKLGQSGELSPNLVTRYLR